MCSKSGFSVLQVFKTGQSPHVMSEIKAESAPPTVRLPTTRGDTPGMNSLSLSFLRTGYC